MHIAAASYDPSNDQLCLDIQSVNGAALHIDLNFSSPHAATMQFVDAFEDCEGTSNIAILTRLLVALDKHTRRSDEILLVDSAFRMSKFKTDF